MSDATGDFVRALGGEKKDPPPQHQQLARAGGWKPEEEMHQLVLELVRRKRKAHYGRAVERGIITSEQATALSALYEEELDQMEAQRKAVENDQQPT